MSHHYKYRSLQNWQFVLDALLKSRLFAATFEDLNDPMEGLFRYDPRLINENVIDRLVDHKKKLKICSLSATATNDLMWSYYADGHSGICLEVSVEGNLQVTPVDYSGIANLQPSHDERFAYTILSRKESFWIHERESRVISTRTFVPIKIHRVIFGKKMKQDAKALISELLRVLEIPYVSSDDL